MTTSIGSYYSRDTKLSDVINGLSENHETVDQVIKNEQILRDAVAALPAKLDFIRGFEKDIEVEL